MIQTPISVGELVDKLSILGIKKEQIKDEGKLANVNREFSLLHTTFFDQVLQKLPPHKEPQLMGLAVKLRNVNKVIWDIEDGIRECERLKDFGPKFVEYARGVYHNNDERARLKREINDLVGSQIVEEKSYTDYKT